jgi:hypothetical protein
MQRLLEECSSFARTQVLEAQLAKSRRELNNHYLSSRCFDFSLQATYLSLILKLAN